MADDADQASQADEARAAFFRAIRAGDRAQVERSLAAQPALSAARDAQGVSAPLVALYHGEPAIATLLAEAGAPLDVFEAAALGRVERLGALLAADPALAHAVAPDGFSPLGLAAFFGQAEAAHRLLEAGADPNRASQNAMRVAPLHSAVAAQRLAISEELLRHGADVNAAQADDFTPLHEAAQNGQLAMIELLLAHGADPTARKSDGQTPLDVAEAHGQTAAAELLRRLAGG
ncbi:MAG TPA: ankyrin repeat domain-containing protein [Ktedonobacterales bacterium]|nr:ankyrin repeat domain-containing protein [Ktedonobacterales bacterium]